LSFYYSYLRE